MNLNQRAYELCQRLVERAEELRVGVEALACGATLIDLGIQSPGGLQAGLALAEICTSGLARVEIVPSFDGLGTGFSLQVATDHPVLACMASQYAGWQIAEGKFFAIGSGPMRLAAGKEELLARLGLAELAHVAVGVLETRKLPTDAIAEKLASQCRVLPNKMILLVAPTASLAGTMQVVARSVETALHKLHELGFDLHRVQSALGAAPLPPIAKDDLAAIGRSNDAILYGGEVTLFVRGEDASLLAIGPNVPSDASRDYGRPFSQIFESAGRDFYKIDPLLFSPAVIRLQNLDTGNLFVFGRPAPEVLALSFESTNSGLS